jgi:HEAT repeat protein
MDKFDQLITQLHRSKDHLQRRTAARKLGDLGDGRSVEHLMLALRDEDFGVRALATEALGKIGAVAAEPLLDALMDADYDVRWRAIEALGAVGGPQVVETLIRMLTSDNSTLCAQAVHALGIIGDPAAVDELIESLADVNAGVRKEAATALGLIGHQSGLPALKARLRIINGEGDAEVRIAIRTAIGWIERTVAATKGLPRAAEAEAPTMSGRPRAADGAGESAD